MIVPHAVISAQVKALWQSGGLPKGELTGWPSVDKLYTVGRGQWTLITGMPGSGKSEWLDALLVNLAKRGGWRFIVYSPENWPLELHHAKLIEKYLCKPFNPGPTQRLDEEELDHAQDWLHGKFLFAKPTRPDVLSILEECAEYVSQADPPGWKLGVVIDPWNQLEHHRPQGVTETEYVSATLSRVIDWVRELKCHLWLVAHPAKLQRGKDGKLPVPTPNDVSGSAHFWNKADNCITVWRDPGENSPDVDIHVQKVRWRHIGRSGATRLLYDRVTGQYREPPPKLAAVSGRDD